MYPRTDLPDALKNLAKVHINLPLPQERCLGALRWREQSAATCSDLTTSNFGRLAAHPQWCFPKGLKIERSDEPKYLKIQEFYQMEDDKQCLAISSMSYFVITDLSNLKKYYCTSALFYVNPSSACLLTAALCRRALCRWALCRRAGSLSAGSLLAGLAAGRLGARELISCNLCRTSTSFLRPSRARGARTFSFRRRCA